jgi:hypothetical protein
MENKIDLDAIITDHQRNQSGFRQLWLNTEDWTSVKELMKETALQALVLASEKATCMYASNIEPYVEKQSILDVEKLIS